MTEEIKEEQNKSRGRFRKLMVLVQLGVILFVVLVSLIGTGHVDGGSFFSNVLLFFLRVAGIEPPAPAGI
jgi:hypothetical protein